MVSRSRKPSSPKRPRSASLPKPVELPERSNRDFARRLSGPVTRERFLYTSHTTFLARWSAP
ncbi:MAG: hypothetical protein M3167_10225 [Acidobacteriota bacterium]|nr:hypothetical protein [Acidobacteriota bacterium]